MRASPGTYAVAPLAAALDPRLGKLALRLVILMASYRNKDGQCWPAVETLAKRLLVDRRAVQRAIAELVDCGHLARTRRTLAGRGQASNSYTVLYRDAAPAENLAGEREEGEAGEMAPSEASAPGEPLCLSASHAVIFTAPVDPERSISPPPCGQTVHPGAVNLTTPGAVKTCRSGRSPVPPKEESNNTIEHEYEAEEERARAREAAAAPPNPPFRSDEDDAVSHFNEAASRVGWVRTQHLTSTVRKNLRSRLGEAGGLQGWRDALAKAEASIFLTMKMRPTLSLDWLVDEDHFARLMHGRYDPEHDPPVKLSKQQRAIAGLNAAMEAHREREAEGRSFTFSPRPEAASDVNENLATLSRREKRPHQEVVQLAFKWKDRLTECGLGADEAREVVVAAVAEGVRTHLGLPWIEERVNRRIEQEKAAA